MILRNSLYHLFKISLLCILLLYQLRYVLADGQEKKLQSCESLTNLTQTECSTPSNVSGIKYDYDYCISKDNEIKEIKFSYKMSSGNRHELGSCFSKLNQDIYIFNANNELIDLTEEGVNGENFVENYVMYVCSILTCSKTSGYIKIDNFYKKLNEIPSDWENNCRSYYLYTSNDKFEELQTTHSTVCSEELWKNNPYYELKYDIFYFINHTNDQNLPVNANAICGVGQEGNLFYYKDNSEEDNSEEDNSEKYKSGLCLGVKSEDKTPVEIEFDYLDSPEYYLTKSTGNTGFSINLRQSFILKRTANIIYHYNLRNDESTVIVDMDTKQKVDSNSLEETFKKDNLSDSDLSKYNIYKCNSGICEIYYGHNVVNVKTTDIINLNNTTSTYFDSEYLASIAILNCDDNSCKRTYGYIKTSDDFYYSISYPKFNNTKLTDRDFISNCNTNADIGKLITGGNFCQKIGYSITDPMKEPVGDKYIYYIISAEEKTIFHDKDMGKSLIISATTNTLIFDGLSTNKGLKLFGNGAIIKVEESDINKFQNALTLYYCDDKGLCKSLNGYVTDGNDNYYQIYSDGSDSTPVNQDNECTSESIGKLDNYHKFCLGHESISFLTNGDKAYYIFKKDGNNYSLVRGIPNIFAIEDHNYSGDLPKFNVINTDSLDKIDLGTSTAIDLTNNKDDLALFNCDTSTNVCKQTFGYIKSNDSSPTYYSFNKDKINTIVDLTSTPLPTCATDNDVGKLQPNGSLCLINSESSVIEETMINYKEYVISVSTDNIFLKNEDDTKKNIVIKATDSAFYYDNFCSEDIVLTTKASKIETTAIDKTIDESSLVAYSCNIEGICTQVGGFVTNGKNEYFELTNSSNSSKVASLYTDCSSINQLTTGGKLCVNNNISYALGFLTDGTKYYMSYNGSTYSLIIAKKNIFIIREVEDASDGTNIVNVETSEIVTTTDKINYYVLKNIVLFLCDRNKTKLCNQTFGYIKIESEYYAIASNNTNSKYSNSGVKTCQDVQSIIGELTSSGGLCLGGTNSGSLADSVYVMSGRSDSIFSNGTKSILIKSTINSHVLNNLVDNTNDGGVKLFEKNKLLTVTSDIDDGSSLSLYICNSEGICYSAEGYAKNSNGYYSILSGSSTKMNGDANSDCLDNNTTGVLNSNKEF
ncbi:hypothetical protein LY90DRAFT_678909, partial [Neocallimastix californiae]